MGKEVKVSLDDVKRVINVEDDVRNRAFCSIMYLTGARVSEIVKRFKADQVVLTKIEEDDFCLFQEIYTLKNKKHPLRTNPIRMWRDPYKEGELVQHVLDWISFCRDEGIMFNMHRATGFKIVQRVMGHGVHWLRHVRTTHLVRYYNFNQAELRRWFGWTDTRPASIYEGLMWRDFTNKI